MDIPSIAGGALDTAWTVADSVLKAVTVKQGPTPSFDPTTDVTTTTWATTTTGKKGLPYAPKLEEIETGDHDAFVQGRMVKMLLRSVDFPAAIAVDDIVTYAGYDWQIKSTFQDPSEKVTILMLLR